jgi:hypothetical protein
MPTLIQHIGQGNGQRIIFNHAQLAGKGSAQLSKRGQAAGIAFDSCHFCTSAKQGARQATGAGPHFIDASAGQITGNGGYPIKQLAI